MAVQGWPEGRDIPAGYGGKGAMIDLTSDEPL